MKSFINLHNEYFPKNNNYQRNPTQFKLGNTHLGILVYAGYAGSTQELLFASNYKESYKYCVIKKEDGSLKVLDIYHCVWHSFADVIEDNVKDEFYII